MGCLRPGRVWAFEGQVARACRLRKPLLVRLGGVQACDESVGRVMTAQSEVTVGHPAVRYGKSLGIGAAFAVGWTPCIGPILGAILTLAASSGTVLQATFLLAAWSLRLGVPFLIAGLAMTQVMAGIRKIRAIMPLLEIG